MKKTINLFVLVSAIASGCASDKSANPAMPSASQPPADRDVVWANKVIELGWVQEYTKRQTEELDKQRQSAYKQMVRMASQQNELQDVVDAIDNIKREAKADNELSDWVANNQDQLKASFTDKLGQTKQERFESLGLQGEVLKDWVDEVTVQGKNDGKNILSVSEEFLWKSSDGSGGIARIQLGFNYEDKAWVGHKVINSRQFSNDELSALGNDNSKQTISQLPDPAPASTESSSWKPNNETINALYQAGIDILTSVIEDKVAELMKQ
jgi:hypothetical protein